MNYWHSILRILIGTVFYYVVADTDMKPQYALMIGWFMGALVYGVLLPQ